MVFDILFTIDIFVQFVSAYHDDDYYLIDDLKNIAKNYLTTWFVIDVSAIFPFDLLNT